MGPGGLLDLGGASGCCRRRALGIAMALPPSTARAAFCASIGSVFARAPLGAVERLTPTTRCRRRRRTLGPLDEGSGGERSAPSSSSGPRGTRFEQRGLVGSAWYDRRSRMTECAPTSSCGHTLKESGKRFWLFPRSPARLFRRPGDLRPLLSRELCGPCPPALEPTAPSERDGGGSFPPPSGSGLSSVVASLTCSRRARSGRWGACVTAQARIRLPTGTGPGQRQIRSC